MKWGLISQAETQFNAGPHINCAIRVRTQTLESLPVCLWCCIQRPSLLTDGGAVPVGCSLCPGRGCSLQLSCQKQGTASAEEVRTKHFSSQYLTGAIAGLWDFPLQKKYTFLLVNKASSFLRQMAVIREGKEVNQRQADQLTLNSLVLLFCSIHSLSFQQG